MRLDSWRERLTCDRFLKNIAVAVRVYPAILATMFAFFLQMISVPVFAEVCSVLLLDEHLSIASMLGEPFIVVAMLCGRRLV